MKKILYDTFSGNKCTKYGLQCEPLAIHEFEEITNFKVNQCGLFVGREDEYFLGASPDGTIAFDDTIMEVKCPYTLKNLTIEDGIKNKKINYLQFNEKLEINLKRNHNYYYQIQGQLHLTKKEFCYFMVWSNMSFHIEKIERDDDFWNSNMKTQLETFFYSHLLPEILKRPI